MKVLLLIPSVLKTGIEDAVAADRHPRMDYHVLRDKIDSQRGSECGIIGYTEVEADPRLLVRVVRRLVGRDFALALIGYLDAGKYDAVFTNGENVALPLALLWKMGGAGGAKGEWQGRAKRPAHVSIGHRLSAGKKRFFFRDLRLHEQIDTLFVYARTQAEYGKKVLNIPAEKLRLIPFHADERFFRPMGATDAAGAAGGQVCAAGLEWRDYPTLIRAAVELPGLRVRIAAASPWSKHANETERHPLPANVDARRYDYAALRDLYSRSSLAAVPLYENDFQAGVTTLLEAMAMGMAVIVTRTEGQRDVVTNGENGVYVAPGDADGWRSEIESLRADDDRRGRLGAAARRWVEANATLDGWAANIAAAISAASRATSAGAAEGRKR